MLSSKQKRFISFVRKENRKPIDVNDANEMFRMVALNLFEMYLTADDRSDKRDVAWMIHSLRSGLKEKIRLWHLIENKEEYIRLLKEKQYMKSNTVINQQESRHRGRNDFSFTHDEWMEVLRHFNNKCAYCGNDNNLTYDHFHPFSKGGDFMKGNIIPACHSCNSSKYNHSFDEWYPEQSFYDVNRERKIINYIESNRQLTLL